MEVAVKYEKLTYSVAEAAEVLGVSTANMYQIIKQRGFPVVVLGKRRLIPIKALERWVEDMAAQGWQQFCGMN